jgi:hypothetical protein
MKRILIASDEVFPTQEGGMFRCLMGAEALYRTRVRDVSGEYRETCMDGWDGVVINDDAPIGVSTAVRNIRECNPQQLIVVVTQYHDKMLSSVKNGKNVIVIPRNAEVIEKTFADLGLKAAA